MEVALAPDRVQGAHIRVSRGTLAYGARQIPEAALELAIGTLYECSVV